MKTLIIAMAFFISCHTPTRIEKKVKYAITGRDIASDRFGNQSHYIYTYLDRYEVSGVEYYSLTDSIEVIEIEYKPL